MAYPEETMRLDRGLFREARSGFDAALKQLDRVICCGGDAEEEWPLMDNVVGGDDDSIRVVSFLHGRRKVDSPASSPSSFKHTFGDTWPLRGSGGEGGNTDCWANCAACDENQQREDSVYGAHQSTERNSDTDEHTLPRTEERREHPQDLYLDAPCTPVVLTFGPTSNLDWLRFSYLLRNNNLSFDDIAELVSRHDGTLSSDDTEQQETTTVGEPEIRNSTLRISVRRSGAMEWDVSTLGKDGQASTVRGANSRHTTSMSSCGAEDLESNGIHVCHQTPPHAQDPPTNMRISQRTEYEDADTNHSHHRRSSGDLGASKSCFSSDSSVDSLEFSKPKVALLPTKSRPTVFSWLKPKRKYDRLQGATPSLVLPSGPREYPAGLWKRISKATPNHATDMNSNPKGKVILKLQSKLSLADTTASRTSATNQNAGNNINDCHPAYRAQPDISIKHPGHSTPSHILNAMKSLHNNSSSSPLTKPNAPRTTTSKPPKASKQTTTNLITKPRPSSSIHTAQTAPRHCFPRPYKPSPLKHVTRVTSLDVNKGLPALPPVARRRAHEASKVVVQELQAVRKVAVKKAVEGYVDDKGRAY